jgi:hypothetical protein
MLKLERARARSKSKHSASGSCGARKSTNKLNLLKSGSKWKKNLLKITSCLLMGLSGRHLPAEVAKTERTVISGMPDIRRITTSHVEKQNHTLRMHCRRLTRLTDAFSKKFEAAVALNFAYYNFCKTHKAIRMTPAQAAGIESSAWTVEELIKTLWRINNT